MGYGSLGEVSRRGYSAAGGASPVTTIFVEGGDLLAEQLGGMERGVARGFVRDALRVGGAPILATMRAGIRSQTGLLAASLIMRAGRGDRPGRTSLIISATTTREQFALHREQAGFSGHGPQAAKVRALGAAADRYSVYYGLFVEEGHAGPFGSDAATAAHPFARPAFDSHVEQSADAIETKLFEGIDNPPVT